MQTLTEMNEKILTEVIDERAVYGSDGSILFYSLGGQTAGLIEMRLSSEIGAHTLVADPVSFRAPEVKQLAPLGIVLSGGPVSVYENPPPFDTNIFNLGIPVLGICLGWQLGAQHFGYTVENGDKREFGAHTIELLTKSSPLFAGVPDHFSAFQNHGDRVLSGPGMEVLAKSENAVAAGRIGHVWGVQFHPEVSHTEYGLQILYNFVVNICGEKNLFDSRQGAERKIAEIQKLVGDQKVLGLVSGGCDSSIALEIFRKALDYEPGRITALYMKGIDRPDDFEHVQKYFGNLPDVELIIDDCTDKFLAALKGRTTMRDKRLGMIGVYTAEAEKYADAIGAPYILDGSLLTDFAESGKGKGGAHMATIKIHHNTQGFAERFTQVSPLSDQVKNTGRNIGLELGVPRDLVFRQPFPGPGLVVRIEGEITAEKLEDDSTADGILIRRLRQEGLYSTTWQAGAVLTLSEADFNDSIEEGVDFPTSLYAQAFDIVYEEVRRAGLSGYHEPTLTITRSVTTCVKGDDAADGLVAAISCCRTRDITNWALLKRIATRLTNEIRPIGAVVNRVAQRPIGEGRGAMIATWAVDSVNGFTATATELPWDFLQSVGQEIIAAVPSAGSVVHKISSKPPATIEWG